MAAKFFPVSPAIWNKRIIGLGLETVVVYCYVLTNPHRFSEGLYRLPQAYVVADLQFSLEQVERSLRALEAENLIAYDYEAEVILDPNALHFLPPVSRQQVLGAITKLRQVPRTPLLQRLWKFAIAYNEHLATAMEEAFPELTDGLSGEEYSPPETVSRHYDRQSYRGRQLGEGSDVRGTEAKPVQDQSFRAHEEEVQEVSNNLGGEVVSFRGVSR